MAIVPRSGLFFTAPHRLGTRRPAVRRYLKAQLMKRIRQRDHTDWATIADYHNLSDVARQHHFDRIDDPIVAVHLRLQRQPLERRHDNLHDPFASHDPSMPLDVQTLHTDSHAKEMPSRPLPTVFSDFKMFTVRYTNSPSPPSFFGYLETRRRVRAVIARRQAVSTSRGHAPRRACRTRGYAGLFAKYNGRLIRLLFNLPNGICIAIFQRGTIRKHVFPVPQGLTLP